MNNDYVPHVTAVSVIPPFGLDLTFDDGTRRQIDLAESLQAGPLNSGVFEPLRDATFFAQAQLDDPAGGTVCWPNGADIAPIALYEDAW